ncbi:MAG: hypothetical protein EU531_00520 [Promethearchaeota archaeon]|nr:MAG: hypothetical protein EU531_00520 [Candidatus Lokiarchaeota archaeon]
MTSKKNIFIGFVIIVSLFSISIPPHASLNQKDEDQSGTEFLATSDVAGTDLYAENIDVYVAGNKSIIKQSLFSNDTTIIPEFDTRDPAFYKCNVHFSVSNGIVPEIFPKVITENDIPIQFGMTFNSFSGFLYYEESLLESDVKIRATRALEIIKRKFEIDLIQVSSNNPYFFPFIGYFPDWNIYLREITGNLPMDGYWKALDKDRLTSSEYITSKHLSSTFLLINSLELLEKDFLNTIDQIDFNLESLDLSYLESFDAEMVFEQFSNVLFDYPAIFGNFTDLIGANETDSLGDMDALIEVLEGLSLSNRSYYTNLMIQYEGAEDGITEVSPNKYQFSLWKALNYNGAALRPSEKIFIALLGAFMSNIDINIMCTEITNFSPKYYDFYSFLLEQIETILFYAEIDFDAESLEDYSLELFWTDFEGIKRSYVKPVNLNDPEDYINFLSVIGFQGFEGLPAGILNPLNNFVVSYITNYSEPSILIQKDLIGNNASYGVYNTFSFNITAKNVGNSTVWGNPTNIPLDLEDALALIVGPVGVFLGLDQDLEDAIWEIVRVIYSGQYSSLEDFFNFNEKPRIFYFDTTGAGFIDYYYPNLLNISNLLPYNENMDEIITIMASSYQQLLDSLDAVGVSTNDLRTIFTNKESIWNEENWKLEPGEKLSYEFTNFSIEAYDSFTPFYNYSFLVREEYPNLPYIISGSTIAGTIPQMALENDNQSWIIESEEKYVGYHEIDIQFLFKNQTAIDFENNSLERVSILINMTEISNNLLFEVFNFTSETFDDMSNFSSSDTNSSLEFSFERDNGSLEWIFDPNTRMNHSILIRIMGSDSNSFNISLDNFDVQFSYRDINAFQVLGSRFIYSSFSGNIEYISRSNSITLSTYNMASIVAYGYLNEYSCIQGDLLNYNLILQNIGSETAYNVNISMLIPGIPYQVNEFILENSTLTKIIPEIMPNVKRQLNFSFFSPNTAKLSAVSIKYESNETIANLNSTHLTARPNEVFFSSPIDYKDRFPFIKTVEININSSTNSPQIYEYFDMTFRIKNSGLEGFNISSMTFFTRDQFGDLIPWNDSFTLTNIEYNQIKTFSLTLYKKDWKAYFYPSINHFKGSESRIIQIRQSESIVLGTINLTILKTVEKNQIEIGDIISVNITVINSGSICIKNVSLQDTISFSGINFDLITGKLVNDIPCLSSGEAFSFLYTIRAKTQALVSLKPAFVEQYYLNKVRYQSNEIQIKILIPKTTQFLFIIGPSLGVVVVLSIFLWQRHKYNSKKYERSRYELTLFQDSSLTSVLTIERTLRDYFNSTSSNKSRAPTDLREIPKENTGDSNE